MPRVSEDQARGALHAALDAGITFIDTADVYGDGRSERIIADVLKERDGDRPFVATKAGRRLDPHVTEGFTKENLNAFVDRSRDNLQMECLDLIQLHCPPPAVYGVQSVQIIYNIFRQRPANLLFREAKARNVAIISRVPLASGLLTGKMTASTTFASDDHRAFNRNGEAFDKGETFSGVPYDLALEVAEDIRKLVPDNIPMAQFALRWILMEDAVTVVIPGAKTDAQAQGNAAASDVPPLSADIMDALRDLYQTRIAPHVHHLW